jgi:hypothetical protein
MAFMTTQVSFLFVVVFLLQSDGPLNSDQSDVFVYGAIFAGLLTIVSGRFLKSRLLEQAKRASDIQNKKAKYLSSFLIMMAIPEFAVLFSIIAYWMSGDNFVLGIILVILILEGSQKPGPNKFKIDLQLTDKEYHEIENQDP